MLMIKINSKTLIKTFILKDQPNLLLIHAHFFLLLNKYTIKGLILSRSQVALGNFQINMLS